MLVESIGSCKAMPDGAGTFGTVEGQGRGRGPSLAEVGTLNDAGRCVGLGLTALHLRSGKLQRGRCVGRKRRRGATPEVGSALTEGCGVIYRLNGGRL